MHLHYTDNRTKCSLTQRVKTSRKAKRNSSSTKFGISGTIIRNVDQILCILKSNVLEKFNEDGFVKLKSVFSSSLYSALLQMKIIR